jgi:preprotein translocase subunit SecA
MNKQRESVYALRRELLEGKIHLTEEEQVDSREYLMTLAESPQGCSADSRGSSAGGWSRPGFRS